MHTYLSLVLFAIIYVSADAKREILCPMGEIYKECGTACPPTCEDPNPAICTDQCVRGCFCPEGLVRDENNRCVRMNECRCPPTMIYKMCDAHCQKTCQRPYNFRCPLICTPGCGCPPHLLLDKKMKRCVRPEDCSQMNQDMSGTEKFDPIYL